MRFVLLAALVLSWAATARAQVADRGSALAVPTTPVPRPPAFALDVSASTMLPLVVGAQIGFEVPGHVVFRVGGGVIPSAYVDAVNAVGTGWGAYDVDTAHVASLLLNDATFLEAGLGFRPAGTPGIELSLSYAVLWSHRRIDMAQLGGPVHDAGLDLTIDAIHAELAWQTEPIEHVYFRIALGWAHAIDHHVSIAGEGDAAMQGQYDAAASELAGAVGRYAFGPTLGASLGVRLW